ncbi:uncharacterized protein BX664DRAFT_259172, partial [Halteromyces radiatus]|uniref:uncharacterized protein n=1 Tax=Halteromyces radiatus TaxID=101107 RepID=UPI00221F6A00
AIRVRPLTKQDRSQPRFSHSSDSDVIKTFGNTVTVVPHQKSFNFDYVFDTESTQDQVFNGVASNLVDRFLDGYNATILAYGQTSSGKTHTIMGSTDPDQEGIIPRAMFAFFQRLYPNSPSSSPSSSSSSTKRSTSNATFPPSNSGLRLPRRAISSTKLRPVSMITTNNNANSSPLRRGSAPIIQDDVCDKSPRYTVHVSFVEIYNEELIDLLNPAPPNERPPATIREDTKGHIHWTGVKEVVVNNADDVLRYLQIGTDNRATGSTDMNAKSSRSHAIFSVTLKQEKWVPSTSPTKSNSTLRKREPAPSPVNTRSSMIGMNRRASCLNVKAMVGQMEQRTKDDDDDGEWMIMLSKFHFVDLAGSERLKRTAAEGDRRKEGISINAGLLALGNVISALAADPSNHQKKAAHIPYRDSKLTRLLQDSLGGNATTLMIACISPAELNLTETANTIKYAHRARSIKNKSERNETEDWMTNDSPDFLRSLITKLKTEIRTLKSQGSVLPNRKNSSPTNSHSTSTEEDQPLPPSPSPSAVLNISQPDAVEFDHSQLLVVSDLRRQIEELHNELTVTRERNQWVESQLGQRSLKITCSLDFQHLVEPVIEEYEKSISGLESQLALARAALTHSDEALAQQESKMAEYQQLRDQEHETLATLQDKLAKAIEREQSTERYIQELETKLTVSAEEASRDQDILIALKNKVIHFQDMDATTEKYIQELELKLTQAQEDQERWNEQVTTNEEITHQDDDEHQQLLEEMVVSRSQCLEWKQTLASIKRHSIMSESAVADLEIGALTSGNDEGSPSSSTPSALELRRQLEEKESRIATLERRLEEMDTLHQELVSLQTTHTQAMTDLESQLSTMKENHAKVELDLQTRYDEAQATITALTSQVAKEQEGHQAALSKRTELQQQFWEHEQGTQITLRLRLAELEKLNLDIQALHQVESKQEQIIILFEQKLVDMEHAMGQLQQQLDVKDAHLQQLEQENQQKTQCVQALQKDLQSVLRDMAALGMERKQLDLIVEWMDKSLRRHDDQTTASLISLAELQQLHKLRDADYEARLQLVEKLEARVKELSTSVEEGNVSTRRLTLELTDAKAALADEQQKQIEINDPLTADIDAQRLVALESRVVELDEAVEKATKEREEMDRDLETKQNELLMAQMTIEKQATRLALVEQQLKDTMASMEKERSLLAANDTSGMIAELEDKLQVLQRARQLDQDEYEGRFDRAMDDLDKTKKAYKEQSHVVASLEQSLQTMQDRLEEAVTSHAKKSTQLQQLQDQLLRRRQRSDSTASNSRMLQDDTTTREEIIDQLHHLANDKTQLMIQVDDLEAQLVLQRTQFGLETKNLELELMKLSAANDRMEKEMEQVMPRHSLPQPISASVSSGPIFSSNNNNNNSNNNNNNGNGLPFTSPPQTPRVASPPPGGQHHGYKLHRDLSSNSMAKIQKSNSFRALSAMDYHHPTGFYDDVSSSQRPLSQSIRNSMDRPGSISSTSSFLTRSASIPPPSAPPSNPLPPIPTTPLPAVPNNNSSSSGSSSMVTSPINTTHPVFPPTVLQRNNSTHTTNSLVSDMSVSTSQQSTQTTAEQYDKMLRSLQRKAQVAESDVRAHQDVISKLEHQLSRSETSVRDAKKQLEVLNKEKQAYSLEIKNLRSQVTQIMSQQKSSVDEAGERRKQLEQSLEQERRLKEKAEKARLILENRMEELMTKKNKFMCF